MKQQWLAAMTLAIVIACVPVAAAAQELTVSVDSAGTLSRLLPDSVRFTVAELTVDGQLNGSDLKIIRDIAIRRQTDKKQPSQCLLTSIDLGGAVIVDGKEGMRTKAGELPSGLFSGAKSLVSAVLPRDIVSISRSCFSGCSSLQEVTIPETVTTIGAMAFSGCSALASVSLPQGVKTIGSQAFSGCEVLGAIVVPEAVTTIENGVFNGCTALGEVRWRARSPPLAIMPSETVRR